MLFEKDPKIEFHWSNRRDAAVRRRHKKEQERYPLFADQIAQQQQARAIYFQLPESHRLAIATYWRNNAWLPKKAHYFASLIHNWTVKGWRPNKLQVLKYGLENIAFDYCLLSDGCMTPSQFSEFRKKPGPQPQTDLFYVQ